MEVLSRKSKEQFKTEMEELSTDRINFKLSLRKKNFNNILSKKRIFSNPDSSKWSQELFLSKLVLPQNYRIVFSDKDELISTSLKSIKADDLTTVKYGICLLKSFISYFPEKENIQTKLNFDFISDLLSIIEKWGEKKEKQIVFNILYIITNYSYINTNKNISKILLSPKGYKIYELCFDLQDYEIMSQLVWNLNNIIYDDEESCFNLLKSNLFQHKIFNFYNSQTIINHLNEKDEENIFCVIVERGIALLTNLLAMKSSGNYNEEEKYTLLIPIFELVLKYSETNSPKIYHSCVYSISLSIEKEPRLIQFIEKSNIINDILNQKFISFENVSHFSNRILGDYIANISHLSKEFYEKCIKYEFGIFSGNQSHKNLIEVIWILSNILHDDEISSEIINNNQEFIDKIIFLYKNPIEYNDIRQICYFFMTLSRQCNFINLNKLLNKGLLDISLGHAKNTFDEPSNIAILFMLIEFCLDSGKLMENQLGTKNIIKERCENYGFRDVLRNYENCKDNQLAEITNRIIQNHYT